MNNRIGHISPRPTMRIGDRRLPKLAPARGRADDCGECGCVVSRECLVADRTLSQYRTDTTDQDDGAGNAGVLGVHGLRAEFVRPENVHADLHIEVRRGMRRWTMPRRLRTQFAIRVKASAGVDYCNVHTDVYDRAVRWPLRGRPGCPIARRSAPDPLPPTRPEDRHCLPANISCAAA